MGKIRLKDLARMMKVPEQDLMFKLQSIGVRLEGEDAAIDSNMIQAILQGKNLPNQPREVILRDSSEDAELAQEAPAPTSAETPAAPYQRPVRRRLIHRVEPKIRELEIKEREEAAAAAALAAAASTEAATADAASGEPAAVDSAPEAAAPAEAETAGKTAAKTTAGSQTKAASSKAAPAKTSKAGSAAAAKSPAKPEAEKAAAKPTEQVGKPAGAKPLRSNFKPKARLIHKPEGPVPSLPSPPPRSRRPPGRPSGPPGRRGPGGRPGGRPGQRRDTRRRPMVRSEPAPNRKPASARGHRRAKKREETTVEPNVGGLQFKDSRPDGPVTIAQGMTVREFAEKLGVKSKDLIKTLFSYGLMATINHALDLETATRLAEDLGVDVMEVSFEEEVQLQHESDFDDGDAERQPRAPVVTVMGHVDHGKTTLLDAIRSTDVAEGEAGGITQHIGAYHVDLNDKRIVFLDTPGHEAFTLMRARGARVTDMVILVVAADDGVMPQTIEAINHARAAKVPIVVAINKIDKANANIDRVLKDLADNDLLVEDWGGDTVSVGVSALKGEGVQELLEMVLLNADLLELTAAPSLPARGVVLEARKEVGRGIVATAVIQDGTLNASDVYVAGATWGRVRTMTDDRGERLSEAGPATAVEITGFDELPNAGDLLQVFADEGKVREIASFRAEEDRQRDLAPRPMRLSLESLFDQISQDEVKELPVIVKGDVHGSVEVLKESLTNMSTEKVTLNVLHASVGAISTNDVLLASASNAIIVGFNVRPERNAVQLAEKEEVDVRLHTVIYELMDELKKAMAGLLDPTFREVQQGSAEVRETFKVPKIGIIAGSHVTDGLIRRNSSVRLLRDNVVVFEGKVGSLRRFKDDAAEVRAGFDCGIGLEGFQDLKPDDVIEAYTREEVATEL